MLKIYFAIFIITIFAGICYSQEPGVSFKSEYESTDSAIYSFIISLNFDDSVYRVCLKQIDSTGQDTSVLSNAEIFIKVEIHKINTMTTVGDKKVDITRNRPVIITHFSYEDEYLIIPDNIDRYRIFGKAKLRKKGTYIISFFVADNLIEEYSVLKK